MSVDVGSATGHLDLDISGFLKGLKTAQTEARASMSNVEKDIGNQVKSIGNSMTSAGKTATTHLTIPLLGVGAAGLKVATDFEKGMSEVKAISGATGDEFNRLRDKAIELGADTAFSAGEVAEAMTEMAKAGWSSTQIIDGMGGVLDAAAASGESLATVSTIVADAVTGFGLEAKESTRVADLLTQAANSGTIGINDLGESFKYIAPIAGSMGLNIEDVTTAITAMSMAGIKGSQAGTSLRTMLARMVKPTKNVARAMQELDLNITNEDGSFKSLNDIVGLLRDRFSGLTDDQKAYYATTLAGQEGMSGMLALLNLTQEEYDAISDSMYNAGGIASETATIMQDNLQIRVEQLGGALESLAIRLADQVIPMLSDFVEWLTGIVDKFTEMDESKQRMLLVFAAIVAAIGPVLMVSGKVVESVGAMITAFGKLPAAMNGVKSGMLAFKTNLVAIGQAANVARAGFPGLASQCSVLGAAIGSITAPIAAVIAIIGVLVAAFMHLWNTNEEFRNNILGTWNSIVESFNNFCQGIVDRINALGFNFENILQVLQAAWDGFCNMLAPVFEAAFSVIATVLDTVLNVILGIVDVFIGLFTGNWEQCWTGVQEIFGSIWNMLVQLFGGIITSIIDAVSGFIGSIIDWFSQLPGNIANFVSQVWNSIVEWCANMVNSAMEMGANFLNAVISFFQQLPYNVGYFIGTVLGNIILWASQMWQKAIEMGTNFLNAVISFFTQLPGNILNFITSAFQNVVVWVTNMVLKAQEMGTNFLNAVVSFFTQLPGRILQFITSALQNVQTWVTNMVQNARNMGTNFLSTVVSFMTQLPGRIWNFLSQAISRAAEWVSSMGQKGMEAIKNLIDNVVQGAASIPSKMAEIGKNIVDGVWKGITGAADWFRGQVEGFFGGIVDGVKGALGIGSPSKVFAREVGRWMPAGVAVGFKAAMPEAMSEIQDSLDEGVEGVETPDVDVKPEVEVNGFKDKLMAMYEDVVLWFRSVEERIGGSIDRMSDSMLNLMNQGRLVMASEGGFVDDIGYQGRESRRGSDRPRRGSGDGRGETNNYGPFIFNSPKAIDEIQAAREFKKVQRDISEGF